MPRRHIVNAQARPSKPTLSQALRTPPMNIGLTDDDALELVHDKVPAEPVEFE